MGAAGFGRACGAKTPVHDLGLIDHEAVIVGSRKTGCVADCTVDVRNRTAGAADDVVVVVADPGLVSGNRARGLDVADKAGVGKGLEHVVDRLVGNIGKVTAHGLDDRVRVRMRVFVHRVEHSEPRLGDPQLRVTQKILVFDGRRHQRKL